MTNSISQSKFYDASKGIVRLQNSMTSELDCMRASLIPEGLLSLKHNVNRKVESIKFYEFGNIYLKDYTQEEQLVLFLSGSFNENNWASQIETTTLFQLKGIVQALFKFLGLNNYSQAVINDREIYFDVKDLEIAKIWELTKERLAEFEIEQPVFAARIKWVNVLKLLDKKQVRFAELSKFPEVSRDLAIIVDENINYESIEKMLEKQNYQILKNIELFDIFRSEEKIGAGKKSYALNFKTSRYTKNINR
ncbi:MAG: hypothetical protein LRY27_03440 [Chitinophagales bacterium]|nr:hypothetical protein [Chitinophagales bacterium]